MMSILEIVVELCYDLVCMLMRGVYHPCIGVVVGRGQARRGRMVEANVQFLDPGARLRARKLHGAMRHIVSEWLMCYMGKGNELLLAWSHC
jgi:hypothetical protein